MKNIVLELRKGRDCLARALGITNVPERELDAESSVDWRLVITSVKLGRNPIYAKTKTLGQLGDELAGRYCRVQGDNKFKVTYYFPKPEEISRLEVTFRRTK